MDVGGNDFKDAGLSATYLKTLPYVESDRIGVWDAWTRVDQFFARHLKTGARD